MDISDINLPGLISVIVFYVVILLVGILAAKCVKYKDTDTSKSEQSVLAGRSLHGVIGTLTMIATAVGGGFINGTSESIINFGGLAWTISPFAICVGLTLGGLIYAGRMRDRQYVTMLQPMVENFGRLPAFLVYLASLAGDLFWTASILNALGSTISVIIGLNRLISILVSAGVTVLYTMIGQMISVAYTDVVQLFFIAVGLVIAIPFLYLNDSVGNVSETSDVWIGSIDKTRAVAWVDLAIAMILGTIPWQSYFQRVLSVRSVKEAKILSIIAGFGSLLFAVPPFLIGVFSTATDWSNVSITSGLNPVAANVSSMVLPLMIHEFTPLPVAIIVLGAICGAVMSSVDSSILGSSSMFTHHIYKPIFRRKAGDTELMWIQRVAIFFIGAAATAMSIYVDTIWGLFVLAADIVFVIVLPQLTCSLFLSKTNGYGAILAFFAGTVLRLGAGEQSLNFQPFIFYPYYDYETNEQLFPYRVFAFVISTFVLIVFSYIMRSVFKCGCLPNSWDKFNVLEHGSVKYDLSKDNPLFTMETFTDSSYRVR
ncbi:high affinity choline transporter 1 [Patella vulgata]|uniref:high affinity choline transporter 1 n=1 Tax=Patella vulgata TaxID=6465 RepID=UPI0024A7E0BE|nr:high affinity choline transporter 1 [Patella vulgata]XP_050416214.2 high affinity choline transporter 1 [Patella vulgata]XP_050416215.2 high affinity choline transporter 1 [Patella vulgata]XP_050416216.2 high affinity choline transporter 1 [Patella vulgata]